MSINDDAKRNIDQLNAKTKMLKEQADKVRRIAAAQEAAEKRLQQRAAATEKLGEKHKYSEDEQGNKSPKWTALAKRGEQMRNSSAEAYREWRTNMYDIMNFYFDMGKYFNEALGYRAAKVYDFVLEFADPAVSTLWASRNIEADLSSIEIPYYMNMDEDNNLTLSVEEELASQFNTQIDDYLPPQSAGDTPIPLKGTINKCFNHSVVAWLLDYAPAYELKQNSEDPLKFKVVDRETGEAMNQEQFTALQTNEESNFETFLANNGFNQREPLSPGLTP